MIDVLKAVLAGFTCGFIFAWFRLPIPAPPAVAGIMGIVGLWLGFMVFSWLFGGKK